MIDTYFDILFRVCYLNDICTYTLIILLILLFMIVNMFIYLKKNNVYSKLFFKKII